jgi:hypothetical protein
MGGWRKMSNEKARHLYYSSDLSVDEMGRTCSKQGRIEYKIFCRNLCRVQTIWEIQAYKRGQYLSAHYKNTAWGANWIYLAHDGHQWRATEHSNKQDPVKRQDILRLAERLLASDEGSCSIYFVVEFITE